MEKILCYSVLKSFRGKLQELFLGRDCPDTLYMSLVSYILYRLQSLFNLKAMFFEQDRRQLPIVLMQTIEGEKIFGNE